MGKPHKHAELIKAWADGAEIQSRPHGCVGWDDTHLPSWSTSYNYRIKPEPKPDIVKYICHSNAFLTEHDTKQWGTGFSQIALTYDGETGKLKKVEMIDD